MKPKVGRVAIDSPLRSHFGSSCSGKAVFPSYELARAVTRREGHNERSRLPYHCAHCHQWHLGGAVRHKANRVNRDRIRARDRALLSEGADL